MIDWIGHHEALMTAIIWPALTAILTALFKPRTPEQYAAMNPRVAAFMKFLGSIGLDVPNAVQSAKQLVSGKSASATDYRAQRIEPISLAPEDVKPEETTTQ